MKGHSVEQDNLKWMNDLVFVLTSAFVALAVFFSELPIFFSCILELLALTFF